MFLKPRPFLGRGFSRRRLTIPLVKYFRGQRIQKTKKAVDGTILIKLKGGGWIGVREADYVRGVSTKVVEA